MGDYEQMELDVRLESEKSLKENVAKVIQFTYNTRIAEAEENGRPIQAVKNKHEGYGIASEAYSRIGVAEKLIKTGMAEYLALLQVQGEEAVRACATLYDAALNLAMESIGMAADMNRVLNDLYYGSEKTPLEEYAESLESAESDDFEEADAPEAEDMNDDAPMEETVSEDQSEEEEA
jgi:hemoglobin-like flavoprotein